VDGLITRCGFPVIVKPRTGWTAANVFLLDTRDAIEAACVLVPELIVQRYLPDAREEFTAGVVGSAAQRKFSWIVLRRDLAQGTTYRTELAQDSAIGTQMVALAQALGVEGSCNFQFRVVDGQAFVFEINPRFSGTSGIRYLYGFNDPEMAFEQACLGVPIEQPEVRPGVVLRYWNEVHMPGRTFASMRIGGDA
jgi:carbamoyl-phosphate synthase large subunit